ncbi:uncharacterized protein LOC116441120 [Corvus moneduloides]|uniref:uncharacterized protein LOC116441120 n=1 Tax=Corvus moneduloides TaxID=1196302 RepID=UPI001363D8D6|nr:uncharacterized protein LOC116441120 [Corvus moneduloides]
MSRQATAAGLALAALGAARGAAPAAAAPEPAQMAVPMQAATSQAALPGVALAATAPAAEPHAGVVPASCQPPGRPSDAPLPDDASSVATDTPASLRESVKALRRQQPVTRLARNRPRTFPECKSCVPRAEQRSHGDGGFGSRGLLQVFWTADISSQKPQVMCNLILPNAQPPKIQGLINTGADMTVVSFSVWPPRWPLAPAGSAITGLGRTAKSCLINNAEPAQRYQWKVLPQGMKNSPTICQCLQARCTCLKGKSGYGIYLLTSGKACMSSLLGVVGMLAFPQILGYSGYLQDALALTCGTRSRTGNLQGSLQMMTRMQIIHRMIPLMMTKMSTISLVLLQAETELLSFLCYGVRMLCRILEPLRLSRISN